MEYARLCAAAGLVPSVDVEEAAAVAPEKLSQACVRASG